ncbi:unnamed protein product [Linum trigynum]|uniref:Uncharacterized protein n=1 Tax=Linum trigynum TaxID=586398 RepID=A0AAV2FBD7_9ROSI
MGSEISDDLSVRQGKGIVRSPTGRDSSRGFTLIRSPKIQMGKCRHRQMGKKKLAVTQEPPIDEMARQIQTVRLEPIPQENGGQTAVIQEESRRRRLILEDDLDDDIPDGFPPAARDPMPQPMRQLSSMHEEVSSGSAAFTRPLVPGKEKLGKSKLGRPKSVKKTVEGVSPRKGNVKGEEEGKSLPVPARDGRKLRKAKGVLAAPTHVSLTCPCDEEIVADATNAMETMCEPATAAGEKVVENVMAGNVSDGSLSGGESHNFVIKKRTPPPPPAASKGLCPPSKGRVNQIVAAFEAGMAVLISQWGQVSRGVKTKAM